MLPPYGVIKALCIRPVLTWQSARAGVRMSRRRTWSKMARSCSAMASMSISTTPRTQNPKTPLVTLHYPRLKTVVGRLMLHRLRVGCRAVFCVLLLPELVALPFLQGPRTITEYSLIIFTARHARARAPPTPSPHLAPRAPLAPDPARRSSLTTGLAATISLSL